MPYARNGFLFLLIATLTGCASPRTEPVMTSVGAPSASTASASSRERPTAHFGMDRTILENSELRALNHQMLWIGRVPLLQGGQLAHVKVLGDLVVSVDPHRRVVSANSLRDGSLRWQTRIGTPGQALYEPIRETIRYRVREVTEDQQNEVTRDISESLVFVNSETQLFALDADTGRVARIDELPHRVLHGPTHAGNRAIFGSMTGMVFAHDLITGATLWRIALREQLRTPPAPIYFAGDAGAVYVVDMSGQYKLLRVGDPPRGDSRILWEGRFFGPVTTGVFEFDDKLIVASHDTKLYALNRALGEEAWAVNTGRRLVEDPVRVGDTIYLPIGADQWWVLDGEDGRVLWRGMLAGPPVGTFEGFLVLKRDGFLSLHDINTGRYVEDFPIRDVNKFIRLDDDRVLVASPEGRLILIRSTR
ncbi:MAG: PQQ-binding-like beta-propeller repeat protein [Phycisphaeraceae bacterium]|nr:PQQ-binding-like beta-propeller repeat protein [Phycisphaeraceae bacterium]